LALLTCGLAVQAQGAVVNNRNIGLVYTSYSASVAPGQTKTLVGTYNGSLQSNPWSRTSAPGAVKVIKTTKSKVGKVYRVITTIQGVRKSGTGANNGYAKITVYAGGYSKIISVRCK
jgi:hypothetical protein